MRTTTKLLTIALSAGLVGAGLPAADAAVQKTPTGYTVTNPAVDTGSVVSGSFSARDTSDYTFLHPAAGVDRLHSYIYFTGYAHGRQLPIGEAGVSSSSNGDSVTFTNRGEGVTVKRTLTARGNTVTVDAEVTNTGSAATWATLDIMHNIWWTEQLQARGDDTTVTVAPPSGQGYEVTASFPGATRAGSAASRQNFAREQLSDTDASVQAGEWTNRNLQPGETLSATATFTTTLLPGGLDTDGDGLLDDWETRGYPLPGGEVLPLHRWGADPDRKDAFLQLNWMKSEWEDQGCDRANRYAVSGAELEKFLHCSTLNANSYRPSIATLTRLEDLFADHDIALHIDAGELYKSGDMIGYETRHGGKTEAYDENFFDTEEYRGFELMDVRDELLGERRGVFHVGVIGDKKYPGELSSGEGMIEDGAFFVAKGAGLNSQDMLAKTILHEFGHNLGLSHYGINGRPSGVRDSEFLHGYKSSMNYLYQFRSFNFSDTESHGRDAQTEICRPYQCFLGDYSIPADWDSLRFNGSNKGINAAKRYVEDNEVAPEPDTHADDETVRDLTIAAADQNEGKAGFALSTDDDSGIVTLRNDNVLHGKLSNLGLDPHKFTVTARFDNGGVETQAVTLPGILVDGSTADVQIPVPNAGALRGPKTKILIEVRNDQNQLVYNERYDVSVLDYNRAEATKALAELDKSNASQAVKDRARARLDATPKSAPKPSAPKSTVVEAPATVPATTPVVDKQEASSGSSTGGIIAAILAVLGVIGAAAFAVTQGYVQIPGLKF